MVVVVYKCTLNLVSPAPLTRDCWASAESQSASVLSALPPQDWPGRATCQASRQCSHTPANTARAQTGSDLDWVTHKCTPVLTRMSLMTSVYYVYYLMVIMGLICSNCLLRSLMCLVYELVYSFTALQTQARTATCPTGHIWILSSVHTTP